MINAEPGNEAGVAVSVRSTGAPYGLLSAGEGTGKGKGLVGKEEALTKVLGQ